MEASASAPEHRGESLILALAHARAPKVGVIIAGTHCVCRGLDCMRGGLAPSRSACVAEVLLLLWSYDTTPQFHVVEYFAGQAQVSMAFRDHGYQVASYDNLYSAAGMDFLGAGGFGLLGAFCRVVVYAQVRPPPGHFHDATGDAHLCPRLFFLDENCSRHLTTQCCECFWAYG